MCHQDYTPHPHMCHQDKRVGVGTTGPSEMSRMGDEVRPLLLSEALPVVPTQLVKKIAKGDFGDMTELLRDKINAREE